MTGRGAASTTSTEPRSIPTASRSCSPVSATATPEPSGRGRLAIVPPQATRRTATAAQYAW